MNKTLVILFCLVALLCMGACSDSQSPASDTDQAVDDATQVVDETAGDENKEAAKTCCGGTCDAPAGYCCNGVCCPDLPIWDS